MAQYTLKLSFDLRQVTQSLAYEFVLQDNAGYPMVGGGSLAGTFNFQQGDEIFVEVMATSAANPNAPHTTPKDVLKGFSVKNCTFVSVPARMTEHLSLFDESNACAQVNDWGPLENASTPEDKQKDILRLFTRSITPLPVATKNGQWQISGYLSVELSPLAGAPFAQLYFFDPEGSSGEGGGFNK